MWQPNRESETICGIATPLGRGGIAVIRLSGPQALEFSRKCVPSLPENLEDKHVYFGTFRDNVEQYGIDDVIVTYFKKGKSFTGEDTIELSCHGSPVICRSILEELVKCGAKISVRGEFTFRAFMNGKLDLVQAESVLALIDGQTKRASRLAFRQLKGHLSKKLEEIEKRLITTLAQIEAGIDFAEQEIEVLDRTTLLADIEICIKKCDELMQSFNRGSKIKDGIVAVLVGKPNVGKSSLLNLLIEEEKAIVTDIPGTTRDLVEGEIEVNGIMVKIVDTAGLRETSNIVEQIGIQKARNLASDSDLVIYVFDVEDDLDSDEIEWLRSLDVNSVLLVGNKVDKILDVDTRFISLRNKVGFDFRISKACAIESNGVKEVFQFLEDKVKEIGNDDSGALIQGRHFDELVEVDRHLKSAKSLFLRQAGGEIIALDLYESLGGIKRVLGKEFKDDILDRIFSEFCLGK